MAVLVADCPHCSTASMTFPIFGVLPQPASKFSPNGPKYASVAGECASCHQPISAMVMTTKHYQSDSQYRHACLSLASEVTKLDVLGFALVDYWPQPSPLRIPESLPDAVERSFKQAEINFAQPDCEEAAGMMYRRSLDVGLKIAFPEAKGSIDAKLRKLIASHELPASLGAWANAVRVIGNESAHELDGITRDDLVDARAFIDTVLRYIFTLPAQIEARESSSLPTVEELLG